MSMSHVAWCERPAVLTLSETNILKRNCCCSTFSTIQQYYPTWHGGSQTWGSIHLQRLTFSPTQLGAPCMQVGAAVLSGVKRGRGPRVSSRRGRGIYLVAAVEGIHVLANGTPTPRKCAAVMAVCLYCLLLLLAVSLARRWCRCTILPAKWSRGSSLGSRTGCLERTSWSAVDSARPNQAWCCSVISVIWASVGFVLFPCPPTAQCLPPPPRWRWSFMCRMMSQHSSGSRGRRTHGKTRCVLCAGKHASH